METTEVWLSGALGPGPWLAALGATLAVVGTLWQLVRSWPATAEPRRSAASSGVVTERVGSGTSSETLGVLGGGIAGFVLAVALVTPALPPDVPLRELIPILVLSLGGAWLGMVVGRHLGLG
jgi:hypothetical protein